VTRTGGFVREQYRKAILELEQLVGDRALADADGTVDEIALRLLEVRVNAELAENVDRLCGVLRDLRGRLSA
jgi:hypothetical protein